MEENKIVEEKIPREELLFITVIFIIALTSMFDDIYTFIRFGTRNYFLYIIRYTLLLLFAVFIYKGYNWAKLIWGII